MDLNDATSPQPDAERVRTMSHPMDLTMTDPELKQYNPQLMNINMSNYSMAANNASIELPNWSTDPTLSVNRDKLKDFTKNKIFMPQPPLLPLQAQASREGSVLDTPETEFDAKAEHDQYQRQFGSPTSNNSKVALPMVYSPD